MRNLWNKSLHIIGNECFQEWKTPGPSSCIRLKHCSISCRGPRNRTIVNTKISSGTRFPNIGRLTVFKPTLLLLEFLVPIICPSPEYSCKRVLEVLSKIIDPAELPQMAPSTGSVFILRLLARPSIFDSICYFHRNTWLVQVYRSLNWI